MNKKLIVGIILLFAITLLFTGCNKQIIDTTHNFNYAIIWLQNNTIVEGKVQSWRDFEDGDQLQIKIDNVTYLVHSSNCTLINK